MNAWIPGMGCPDSGDPLPQNEQRTTRAFGFDPRRTMGSSLFPLGSRIRNRKGSR
jgi:hypothetical protein